MVMTRDALCYASHSRRGLGAVCVPLFQTLDDRHVQIHGLINNLTGTLTSDTLPVTVSLQVAIEPTRVNGLAFSQTTWLRT
jgi:hypothetical protein